MIFNLKVMCGLKVVTKVHVCHTKIGSLKLKDLKLEEPNFSMTYIYIGDHFDPHMTLTLALTLKIVRI